MHLFRNIHYIHMYCLYNASAGRARNPYDMCTTTTTTTRVINTNVLQPILLTQSKPQQQQQQEEQPFFAALRAGEFRNFGTHGRNVCVHFAALRYYHKTSDKGFSFLRGGSRVYFCIWYYFINAIDTTRSTTILYITQTMPHTFFAQNDGRKQIEKLLAPLRSSVVSTIAHGARAFILRVSSETNCVLPPQRERAYGSPAFRRAHMKKQ